MKLEKNVRQGKILALFLVMAATSQFALAEDSGWYVGANLGRSLAEIDDQEIRESLFLGGFTGATLIDDDDRDQGYKVFGGYQFNRNFAVEGGYFDLGEFGYTATVIPPGTVSGELETRGVNLDLVGLYNFTEKFAIFGRVGAAYAKTEVEFVDTGIVHVQVPSRDESDLNYKYGFGLQYALSPSWDLRLEAERYRINDAVGDKGDIDLASLGLVYRFGQNRAEPVKAAYFPPKAEEPKPVPVVVPVVETEKYCTILDLEFTINESDIQLEGMEKLAVVGTFMNKYPKTSAVIEGHSDSVGQPEQNRKLSLERAQSVVDILVKRHNIASSRLSAVGYGASRPKYSNDTAEGKRANRRVNAVIACATDIEGLTPAAARLTMAMKMEFDSDQATVKPEYRNNLETVANYMKAHPEVAATIQGHASNRNRVSASESMRISKLRADNVADYLVKNFGIARSRLTTEGFGENDRFSYNTTAEGQQENQRVNIIFTYKR